MAVAASAADASFPGGSGRIVWAVPSQLLVGVDAAPGSWKALPPRIDASRASWSPDGRRLLISAAGQIYVTGAGATTLRHLPTKRNTLDATWSADGSQVVFSAQVGREGCQALLSYRLRDQREKKLTTGCRIARNPSWSPKGRVIAYEGSNGAKLRICLLTLASRATRCIADGQSPTFSPDGRQIAYSTRSAIVIRDLSGDAERTLNVRSGDAQEKVDSPAWSPDGRKLAFTRSEMVAKYESHIYTINVDGSGLRQFSFGPQDERPDWQPVAR